MVLPVGAAPWHLDNQSRVRPLVSSADRQVRPGRARTFRAFEPGQILWAYGGEGGAIETKDLFDKQAEALVAQGIEGPPYEADRDASSMINSHPASP